MLWRELVHNVFECRLDQLAMIYAAEVSTYERAEGIIAF